MIIKRNIVFDLENRKTGGELITENIPIRMRITYASNRLEIFTGIRVDRNKWDSQKKKVKANTFNKLMQSASDINGKLSDYETEIHNIFKKFELEEEIPTKEEVRFIFNSVFVTEKSKISSKNFFDYYDEFITDNGRLKNWSESTFAKLATVKNHLSEFKHKLSFSFFNEKGLTLYSEFLRDNLKMRNSTIEKQISFLKWFLKWAKAKGYNKNLAFETYKPKLKSTQKKIIFLTQEELKKLNDYEIPAGKNYLERVRDVFLFLCYSGIRYSDAFNLKRSDVKDEYIEITTQKTADSLIIELNKKSKEILEKYNEIPFPNNKALPVISNQKMNEYIQELAKLAEIDEPIRLTYYKGNKRIDEVVPKYDLLGSHAGRRTFICTALSLGIPVNVIMKWTGHSDYKSMKPYIDIADNIKANAMKKFDLI
ncbi:integrase [Chryseobacterium viscerum]|uniref:Integrase n=1 Tax=Chryseobacterium viscerum TaxID=1037377 RepID=A0A316WFT9_9FLAO|nr:site-specific integrase [Chryseobacterium viscerum]PWN58996.1 integrase [Chryseobacterium viscerum]